MPFNISHSGRLSDVLSAAKTSGEAGSKSAGSETGNKAAKVGGERLNKFLDALKSATSDYPGESDAALVMVGDAGENHFSVTAMSFSVSKPREQRQEEVKNTQTDNTPVKTNESSSKTVDTATLNRGTMGNPATPAPGSGKF